VKNTLATVQAIATQSLNRAKSQDDFVSSFSGRIHALARAHTLLSQNSFERADVEEIVSEQVLLGGETDNRIALSGPALTLDQQSSVHLSLILHELATNARKYGALSAPAGRLSINWAMRTQNGSFFKLEWRESGGPKVTAPSHRGFGTTLIEQTLQAYGGKACIQYGAQGLSCELSLPLPEDSRWSAVQQHLVRQPRAWTPILLEPIKQDTLKNKRILIVEDEPIIAMDMESCLIEAGCEIAGSAGSLEKAKQLVAEADCDAALLDSNLSGERVDELAAILTRRNIPFAFVSGYGRESLPEGFREAILLRKPFTLEQVRTVVETLLYRGPDIIQFRRNS
jgi:two-component sensor histidine kinase